MGENHKDSDYRLPQFANLSGCVAGIGLMSLLIGIYFSFIYNGNIPFLFLAISLLVFMLGSDGLHFASKEFVKKINEKEISVQSSVNFSIILVLTPLTVLHLDYNVFYGNTIYLFVVVIFYFFALCYTSLLLWYKKNHSN